MSFFAENKSRPRLALDGVMGQEPPHKRQRSILGADLPLSEVGYGALQFSRTGADPFASFLATPDTTSWPFRSSFDAKILALSAPSFTGPSPASVFIERHLLTSDPSQILAPINLGASQTLVDPRTGIQLPGLTPFAQSRSKTKLCRHFIDGKCKFNEICNFAHSIEELKKLPGEGDQEEKSLLEKYCAKADAEQTGSIKNMATEVKTKLCKHFIEGECKFKEGCHFAHSVEELKKLPDDGDAAGKALLEKYKVKKAEAEKPVSAHVESVASISTECKSKLCKHFISGNCKYKEDCTFAHSIEELKKLPAQGDDAGKALFELYQAKSEAENHVPAPEQIVNSEPSNPDAPRKHDANVSPLGMQGAIPTVGKESINERNADSTVEDKPKRLLKTRMCRHFLVGACKYMELCTFAHSIEELKPPSDGKDMAASIEKVADGKDTQVTTPAAQSKDDLQALHKTKPCRFFLEGACRFGDACTFIHGKEQTLAVNSSGGASQSGVPEGYKTRLCNMWEKGEPCTFGSKCHFAHGLEELRQKGGTNSGLNSSAHSLMGMEALLRARQLSLSTTLPYSYDITDTNWRPFRVGEEAWNGIGRGLMNENLEASQVAHLRGLNPHFGQLEQAGSLAALASIGGVNLRLTSGIYLPSWQTR